MSAELITPLLHFPRHSFGDGGSPHSSLIAHLPMPLLSVRQSAIHGRGVFASKPIRKGSRIIEYTGRHVPWKDIPDDWDNPHTFLFGINDGDDVIDPEIGGNEARWINHSCNPNCEAIEEEGGRVFIYSLRDISPGEELFYDYQLEVDDPITSAVKDESKCFCGASICRGTMLETLSNRREQR